jgi:predicted O-methyltransferase YrrM
MTFDDINQHLNGLVPPRAAEMQRMEEHAAAINFPIVGPAAGHYCYQVARMIGARRVFELGSGYGYSTAWFARAVQENGGGEVHHVVWDAGLSGQARQHLATLGYDGMIRYHVGEAVQTLRETPGPFDLIFNDIEKQDYPASLAVITEKLRPGGVLIVDNVLWHGRIFDPEDCADTTEGVRALTRLLAEDPRWVTSIAPIRDGLLVAWRAP